MNDPADLDRSIAACIAVAQQQGVTVHAPELLHEGSSVIVKLGPHGPVARTDGITAFTRDTAENYAREVEIARWLAGAGAPVVGPWDPAGPFVHDGLIVTLWTLAFTDPPPTGEALAVSLRRCHDVLTGYDGPLPSYLTLLDEAGAIHDRLTVPPDIAALLRRALTRVTAAVRDSGLPHQPLHGDAGLGNVLAGGLWHDWEDCCHGPVAWDLASLVASARILNDARHARAEAALAAYGPLPDVETLEWFIRARGVQVLAWSLWSSQLEGGMRDSTQRRLRWLHDARWAR